MIDDLLGFFFAHVIGFGELPGGAADPALFKAQHESYFLFGEQAVENPEIHMVLMHSERQLPGNVVGDHPGQLHDELFLFRIIAMVICGRKITFVDVNPGIDFSWHDYSPYGMKPLTQSFLVV